MSRRTHLDPRQIEVIDDMTAEMFRCKSGAEKLKIADGAYRFARQIVMAGIRERHPDWDEAAGRRELAQRMSRA
jgi:hypothetical protein